MLLQKEVVAYLAGHVVKNVAAGLVEVTNPASAKDVVTQVILDELSVEDQLNDEVREILSQYSEYMRREQVSYSDMFRKVKNQLIAERKIVRASGRDTGDGQIFVDLVDNPRFDHTYTVFAQVLNGIDVLDRILEGDVSERVEILP